MFWRIFLLAKPFWKTLVLIAILILGISGLKQVEPFVAKIITDRIIGLGENGLKGDFTGLVWLLLALLLARVVITVLNRASWYLTSIYTEKLRGYLREVGFEHLTRLSLGYFADKVSGKMMSQLDRGVNRITNVINNSGMHFVPNVITALISVTIVMRFSWQLGVAALASFVPFSLISLWRFKKNVKLEKREHKLYDRQYAHFWEAISSMEVIKTFMAEGFELKRLKRFNSSLVKIRRKMENNNNMGSGGDVLLEVWMWGLYGYIVWLAFGGSITVGTMVLLIGYISLIREPLWSLNWIYWEARRAQLGAKEYFEILDEEPDLVDVKEPVELPIFKGRIVFDKVSFKYKKGKRVLRNVSFTVKPGETVAFVGPSGSGKTTIASLMMRFYDPSKGRVLLDGVDLKNISRRELRQNVGIVVQDATLFADSIEENLKYGKADASQKELEQAARIANAHEFIKDLPKKYQTQVGERGVKLSGGQKQRLSLARTILKNPPVIILDEATSSLDSHSELLIQQSLDKLLKGRTAVVIAHRLSTVARADKIIVLKNQRVLEQGSHEELMKNKGLYASLFDVQSGKVKRLKEWDLVE